jgi:hypothetical protein
VEISPNRNISVLGLYVLTITHDAIFSTVILSSDQNIGELPNVKDISCLCFLVESAKIDEYSSAAIFNSFEVLLTKALALRKP